MNGWMHKQRGASNNEAGRGSFQDARLTRVNQSVAPCHGHVSLTMGCQMQGKSFDKQASIPHESQSRDSLTHWLRTQSLNLPKTTTHNTHGMGRHERMNERTNERRIQFLTDAQEACFRTACGRRRRMVPASTTFSVARAAINDWIEQETV